MAIRVGINGFGRIGRLVFRGLMAKAGKFEVVGINIGEKDANLDIAKRLGVTLDKGVPAAAFIGPDGKPIGNANQGELEAARGYSPQQVLTFLRNVAEQRLIEKPK